MRDQPVAARLLPDLLDDLARWRAGEDIDFQARYEASVCTLGPVRMVVELFRRLEGSVLSDALYATGFVWKDFDFSTWRDVLRSIADSRQAVYQFVWFAAQLLGLDVLAMVADDPTVDDTAKDFVRYEFPSGAPRAGCPWERNAMEAVGIDAVAMWRRLAAEGAPMKVDFSRLET